MCLENFEKKNENFDILKKTLNFSKLSLESKK